MLDKFFKSWIAIVAFISTTGWLISSIVTIHDSYLFSNSIEELNRVTNNSFTNTIDIGSHLKNLEFKVPSKEETFTEACTAGSAYASYSLKKSISFSQDQIKCKERYKYIRVRENEDLVAFGCGFGYSAKLRELDNRVVLRDLPKSVLNECGKVARKTLNENKEFLEFSNALTKHFNFSKYSSDDSYYVYLNGRWSDSSFSNWSYLLVCLLWLVGGVIVIGISFGLRKWIRWLRAN